MEQSNEVAICLTIAWLLPLLGFAIEIFGGYLWSRLSRLAAYIAIGCIGTSFILSAYSMNVWRDQHHAMEQTGLAYSGMYYSLASFGDLQITLDYYIDSLTLLMFVMITFIATCIHVFAVGYMSDELTYEYVDHSAHNSRGGHIHRPGRFYRFFAYLSLFCFAMLGLVLSGNVFQVFVFWELVGICSFLLIGFYVERRSANVAANKAFIINRVGDFGFIIGLMILWTYCGTFNFVSHHSVSGNDTQPGLFDLIRGRDGVIATTDGNETVVLKTSLSNNGWDLPPESQPKHTLPYAMLVLAGVGVFAGCVGKSAQFPLQTWLPDAMEGPTPVSALVHSATMVAAGVYLAARFYPVFTIEVLLAIAYIGCITLFVAATIAVVATDIKRVLAYSTISQLGYMMLAIGLGGWAAGLFHLVTHAFFKSLMFLCSGAVIYGCHHVQEMPEMGGLRRKMPITAYAMLVGVIAIAGLAIPGSETVFGFPVAFSGYHSKDAILATALAYAGKNPFHFVLFIVPLVSAGITAFYMFRLWFYTFTGSPRNATVYDHCHEVPKVMFTPLIVLSLLAAGCAFGGEHGVLFGLIEESAPNVFVSPNPGTWACSVALPDHHEVHDSHSLAGMLALMSASIGALSAYCMYCKRLVDPAQVKNQLQPVYNFLSAKWQFDDLYDALFIVPSLRVGRLAVRIDRTVLDGVLHGAASMTKLVSTANRRIDELLVDGLVNLVGTITARLGNSLHIVQTGNVRQYVLAIAISVVVIFSVIFGFLPRT